MFDKLKKKFARKINNIDSTPSRDFVPFNARLGSHITISSNTSIIYDSLCIKPDNVETITAIGTFHMGQSKVFRLYFRDDMFIQVITDEKNDIEECRLLYEYETVMPSTSRGWGKWIANHEGKIGQFNFTLADRDFIRMESWADPDEDWVRPISVQEKITSLSHNRDQKIITSYKQNDMMGYGRWLNEDHKIAEYLIISSEEITNAAHETIENKVSICVGIDISMNEIEII